MDSFFSKEADISVLSVIENGCDTIKEKGGYGIGSIKVQQTAGMY